MSKLWKGSNKSKCCNKPIATRINEKKELITFCTNCLVDINNKDHD